MVTFDNLGHGISREKNKSLTKHYTVEITDKWGDTFSRRFGAASLQSYSSVGF